MNLRKHIEAVVLAGQHGHPTGVVGRMLGERMVRQHVPETDWTISLLNLKPEDSVLELGFGAGKAIELVTAQVSNGHVSGIDHSQAMVRSASRRNAQAIKAGRVTLRQADFINLPFADSEFDNVFSIQTLYFWSDMTRILSEIFRVLKSGGLLVVTLSTGTTDNAEGAGLEHYQQIIEEKMIPAMTQIGFTEASIKQGPASRQFKTTAVTGVK